MPPVTIVENEFITVQYLPDDGTIYHVIHQPISGQPFRDALDAGTEALVKHNATRWLSDDRKNGPIPVEDLQWSLGDWCPRMANVGWKLWAIVVPEDLAAAGTLMPVIDELFELGVAMSVFTDLESAFAWLRE